MLISLDRLTLPASTTTRGAVSNFTAKDSDMLWDTDRGVVWVKPKQFGQDARVFGIGPGVELLPAKGAFEQLYPPAPAPKKTTTRAKDGGSEATA